MTTINIPQVKSNLVLKEDWKPELGWGKRNLVLLRHLKFTGKKAKLLGQFYLYDKETGRHVKDENGNVVRENKYINQTVPNPLFKDDDGNMVPVTVCFPAGTVLSLTKYGTSYNGHIEYVWLKVESSPDSRIVSRCVETNISQMNLMVVED